MRQIDLFEQETNSKRNIKCQGYRQCSTLEGQKDYYGDIIQKSNGVKKSIGVKKQPHPLPPKYGLSYITPFWKLLSLIFSTQSVILLLFLLF